MPRWHIVDIIYQRGLSFDVGQWRGGGAVGIPSFSCTVSLTTAISKRSPGSLETQPHGFKKTHTAQCCGSFRPTLTQKDSFMDVLAVANGNGPARHSGSTGCAGESVVADSLHRIASHHIASGGKVANIHEDMYSQGLSHVK